MLVVERSFEILKVVPKINVSKQTFPLDNIIHIHNISITKHIIKLQQSQICIVNGF